MSDLLAKCDWDEGELHVELPQWPEVVYVWVDEKTMPYAPVVADVRSLQAENAKLRDEIAELEGTIECLKGLAEATGEENTNLRELVRDMWEFMTTPCDDYCERCVVAEECSERQDYDCCQWRDRFADRMAELGVEL